MATLEVKLVGTVTFVGRPFEGERNGRKWAVVSFGVSGRLYVGSAAAVDGGDAADVLPGQDYIDVVDLNLSRFKVGDKDELFSKIPALKRGSEVEVFFGLNMNILTVNGRGRQVLECAPVQSLTLFSEPSVLRII